MRSVKWFHFKWSWVTPNLHVKVTILSERNKCIEDDVKAAACQSPNCIKKTTNTIRQKRFSIWWMEFFHPAMWHVALGWHVIEFARWQRPSVWHVALGSWHWVYQVAALCNVTCGCEMNGVATRWWKNCIAIVFARWQQPAMWHVALGSWHWIRQVAPSCNVGRGSGIISHWVRPNVRHMGILLLVSILTISLQLTITCHSAPVYEILSKLHRPRQRKLMSCRFSRWQISAILEFRVPVMGSLKIPCTTSYRSSVSHMWLLIDAVFNNVE